MKKKLLHCDERLKKHLFKSSLTMRLCTILVVALTLQVSANGYSHDAVLELSYKAGVNDSKLTYAMPHMPVGITPYAENRTITGKVTDERGEAIPGVNILVQGSTRGTTTDVGGAYAIEINEEENPVLVFSYVGYVSEEIIVGSKSVIDVNMSPDLASLQEVVVVGYGTVKKADLTGSVSQISPKDFKDQPVTRVSDAIQGRMAGVQVQNNSGEPGGSIKIRIRGANSIAGNNSPLIVMDGIQLNNMGLQDINVNDIQSIEVLKDASATAIYGSRGANGVVLVTTKRGKGEKTNITFNSNIGISNRSHKYDLLGPVAYAEMVNKARGAAIYSPAQIDALKNGGGTDWQDQIFRTGYSQNYQIGVGGSTDKSNFYFSGNYIDQSGIVNYSTFKKYAVRSNIETHVTDKLTIGTNIFVNRSQGYNNGDLGYKGSPVFGASIWGPAEPVYNADGTYKLNDPLGATSSLNPVALTKERYWLNTTTGGVLNTKIDYKFTDYLTLSVVGGVDANFTESGNLNRAIINGGNSGAGKNSNTGFNWQNSNILSFHKTFDKHDLTAVGVFEQSKGVYQSTNASGTGLPFEGLYYYNLASISEKSAASNFEQWTLQSWVGRVNYVFNNKYLVTASYRADGSSKFPGNPWGYFPSVALGWRLSEESFIQQLNVFDNLKLRGSIGQTGSQAVPAFATVPQMNIVTYSYGTPTETKGYLPNIPSDASKLRWEKTKQTNIGLDMGFFGNRLTLTADYFKKETTDLLLGVPIPSYAGGGSYLANVGALNNHGFEFVLGVIPIETADFSWNTNLNFTAIRSQVVDLGEAKYIDGSIYGSGLVNLAQTRLIPGEPMGTFYGLNFEGIYQADEVGAAPVIKDNGDGTTTIVDPGTGAARYGLKPGDNKYQDKNNDGKIDGEDRQIIGYGLPKFTYGFNNTITYKSFEFNLFVQGVQGNKVMNMSYAAQATQNGDSQTITSSEVTPWTPENANNMWPNLTSSTSKEDLGSSKWLQDGSFVRIKNVSFAYNVPVEKLRLTSLKLSVSAQNLLTVTKYIGYDPEASTNGGNDNDGGVDLGAYPSPRTFTFSLQIGL